MNEELKEILAGMTGGGGIGSLSRGPGMAQAGDFYGVREPSDSMMIEQGVMPDMSQLEGLTGFEKLQQMQNMGMIKPGVDIYDDSMVYNPQREQDMNMMMFEKMNRDIRKIDDKLIDITDPDNPRIIYAPEDERDIKVLQDGTIVDITDPSNPKIVFSPREAQ
jgi:hypothetical protein